MKVKQAKTAGFCMGVRRALEKVLGEAYKEPGPIFTYGPLIHNEQVMNLLASKGVEVAKDISALKQGTIISRAHGIPPQDRKLLKNSGLRIIDDHRIFCDGTGLSHRRLFPGLCCHSAGAGFMGRWLHLHQRGYPGLDQR